MDALNLVVPAMGSLAVWRIDKNVIDGIELLNYLKGIAVK